MKALQSVPEVTNRIQIALLVNLLTDFGKLRYIIFSFRANAIHTFQNLLI